MSTESFRVLFMCGWEEPPGRPRNNTHVSGNVRVGVPHPSPPAVLSSPATLHPSLDPALVPPGHWPAALGGGAAWLCRNHLAQGCEDGRCSPLAFPYPPLSPRESCPEPSPTVVQPSA